MITFNLGSILIVSLSVLTLILTGVVILLIRDNLKLGRLLLERDKPVVLEVAEEPWQERFV